MVDAMIYKDLGVSAQDQQQVQESQTRRNRNPSFHLVCFFFKKIKKRRQGSHGRVRDGDPGRRVMAWARRGRSALAPLQRNCAVPLP